MGCENNQNYITQHIACLFVVFSLQAVEMYLWYMCTCMGSSLMRIPVKAREECWVFSSNAQYLRFEDMTSH